jgi:nitroreductase
MLAAHALGLTTIYVSDVSSPYFSVMLKSLLNVPDPLQIYQLVPVGFGEKSPTIHHPSRSLKDMVHYEKYDPSLFRSEAQIQNFMGEMSIRGRQYRF